MASATSRTQVYETLLTTTHDAILDSGMVADQLFTRVPLFAWLRAGGRLKILNGGADLRQGLLYGTNSTAKWYSGHQVLDVTPQEGNTAAIYVWKQGSVSISYSGLELRQNKGDQTKIADLIKTKQMQAEEALVDLLAVGVFSDGTAAGSKQITGLGAMIETTPGTTSYAQVPTGNTAWRNQAQASIGNAAVNLLPKMRTLFNDCSQGRGTAATRPDFIVTTQALHEVYESLMAPQLRYTGNEGNDLGLSGLKFKGAPVEWTDNEDTGVMHMLNSRHIALIVHEDAQGKSLSVGGFQKPVNQDSFTAQIPFMGQLVTNNRRKHGKITGAT